MIPVHARLYALAAMSEPDAARELTECADVAKAMLEAMDGVRAMLGSRSIHPPADQVRMDALTVAISKAEGR